MSRLDNPLIVDELCERLSGGEPIRRICADGRMPSASQVYVLMAKDEVFRNRIARAREAQQEHEVDAIVDMADDATIEDHQVVKLRIWARQWRAAKLAPKKYGDKTVIESVGPNGGPVQSIGINTTDPIEAAKVYQRLIGGK